MRLALVSMVCALAARQATADPPPSIEVLPSQTLPAPSAAAPQTDSFPMPASILVGDPEWIDLDSALRLGGVRNPDILIARQQIVEASAQRQLAAAQILPNLNLGTNYNNHTGNLQQSTGNIISVNRQSLYFGAGAGAVGTGSPTVPGIVWNVQVSDALFGYLQTRQVVARTAFAEQAVRNDTLLQIAANYEDLVRTEALRAIAVQIREDAREVARLTEAFAKTGQGRKADADRAATELARRDYDVTEAEGGELQASARLSRLLDLDPSIRLQAAESLALPMTVVSDDFGLPELLATALMSRPELAERQVAIRQAFLALKGAKLVAFTPSVVAAFSAGDFGGGSSLAGYRFDHFDDRTDFDAVMYWSLRNLGVGNRAMVDAAASRLRSDNLRRLQMLDQVRNEVAEAHARTKARLAQIDIGERAVKTAQEAFDEDLRRIRGHEGLPIEVLDSLRLLARAKTDYLNSIVDYNRAQIELYVAIGQPAAAMTVNMPPPAPQAPAEVVPTPPAPSTP